MKNWLLVSNVLVVLIGSMIVYTKLKGLNTLDIGAVAIVIIGTINATLSRQSK